MTSGCLYQYITTKNDARAYPPTGKLIDVGGYNLHINTSGEGGPTVVLDAGGGCFSLDWSLVFPEVAKFTRVCSYDRAGYGWSEESPLERTSENIVEELHTLLQKANIPKPYILVGHSFGGANMRLYASRYPEEIFGLILVDATHEEAFEKMPKLSFNYNIALFLSYFGGMRFIQKHIPIIEKTLAVFSPNIQQIYRAFTCTSKYFRTVSKETTCGDKSMEQLKHSRFPEEKHLIVISAGNFILNNEEFGISREEQSEANTIWKALQEDLVTKSPTGRHLIAEHSDHMIPRKQPEIIIEAIKDLVKTYE